MGPQFWKSVLKQYTHAQMYTEGMSAQNKNRQQSYVLRQIVSDIICQYIGSLGLSQTCVTAAAAANLQWSGPDPVWLWSLGPVDSFILNV